MNGTKNPSPFLCGDLVLALPANISFCVHNIHSKSTKELRLGSPIVTTTKNGWVENLKKETTNAGNKYYFTRFIDNFINFFSLYRSLFDIKRLIFFGIWSIWPMNIGNAEIYIAIFTEMHFVSIVFFFSKIERILFVKNWFQFLVANGILFERKRDEQKKKLLYKIIWYKTGIFNIELSIIYSGSEQFAPEIKKWLRNENYKKILPFEKKWF